MKTLTLTVSLVAYSLKFIAYLPGQRETIWQGHRHRETCQPNTRSKLTEVDNFDNCLHVVEPTPSYVSVGLGVDVLKSRH